MYYKSIERDKQILKACCPSKGDALYGEMRSHFQNNENILVGFFTSPLISISIDI